MILVKPTSLHRTIFDEVRIHFSHINVLELWHKLRRLSPKMGDFTNCSWQSEGKSMEKHHIRWPKGCVFFARVISVFCNCFLGRCFLRGLALVFFALVGGYFWQLWTVFFATATLFSATVMVFSVFCDGNQCFLRWLRGGGL
jgi:hypothetical protein